MEWIASLRSQCRRERFDSNSNSSHALSRYDFAIADAKRRPGFPERRFVIEPLDSYSNPAPRAHLYFAPSTATGISVE